MRETRTSGLMSGEGKRNASMPSRRTPRPSSTLLRGWRLHSDGGDRARLFVASGARWSGFAVGPKGLNWGNRPVAHGGSLAMRPARSAKPA